MTPSNGEIRVTVGEHNECDGVNEGGQRLLTSIVHEHPNYISTQLDNDIAILEVGSYFCEIRSHAPLQLARDITFTARIQPACLPVSAVADYSGQSVTVSGWGGTRPRALGQIVEQPEQCKLKETTLKVRLKKF